MSVEQLFSTTRTEIAGIDILELAEKFGTPFYVYDSEVIKSKIEQLREFDVIRYAQKANSNLAILDLMQRNGVVVDAVSAGEVFRAEKAGLRPTDPETGLHQIVYTADIFDRSALDLVVDKKIHVNVGSPDMIRQYGERVESGEITIRVNPGFGHGHSQKTNTGGQQSKHGIWHEQLEGCVKLAEEHNLKITGLHMHIGSGTDFEHLSQVCDAMVETARMVGPTVKMISAGGGLPTRYKEEDCELDVARYFQLWDHARKELQEEFGHDIQLEIEPGRFLVAECGYLVAEIRAVKQMGENLFYLLDAGFNNLARPILYGSYHPMSIAHRNGQNNEDHIDAVVGGPLCESGDIFTQDEGGFVSKRSLPLASVGDFLVIECAGAYGYVMSSNYNSKPMAAEVLIDGGKAHLVRGRQSLEDLIRGEQIPS